ncbi:MAG: protein jag [Roseburia sp.]|nr:protein jag [Roseburia sp.]
MDFIEISAKTVNDAITEACQKLGVTSDNLDYEIIDEGSNGFLGIGSKPAVIKASPKVVKFSVEDCAKKFLKDVFEAMKIEAIVDTKYDEVENNLDINLTGNEMGILIGKRGATLDSLQYLVSLVVNKDSEDYIRVKVDTENYRQRRKETLENLAKNMAYKVKRTKRSASLEPMNPYERRIIHAALQNDKYVVTHSEGDEPYRRVVITLRK